MLRTVAPHINGIKVGRLPAPIGLTEVRGRAGGAGFYLVDPFRREIAKEFYWGKGRRAEAEDAFALDLMVELSRDADVFLDIGAYTGVFTMAVLAANPTAVAHSFEIIPAVVTGLEKNVARNHLGDRVTVHPTGVGKPGTTMQVPTGDGDRHCRRSMGLAWTSTPVRRCASPRSTRSSRICRPAVRR